MKESKKWLIKWMEDLRGNLKQSSERLEKDLQQVKKYIEKEEYGKVERRAVLMLMELQFLQECTHRIIAYENSLKLIESDES